MTVLAPRWIRHAGAAAALALLAACASAPAPIAQTPGCLSDAQISAWVADYNARKPAMNPPESMTMQDAVCTRARFQQRLAAQDGPLVGYKAGLTNPAVQKRFNTDQPVWGALYTDMLLGNDATVDAAFGARPLYEADLLVRVKDAAINNAKTPAEVLAHVDQVIMELAISSYATAAGFMGAARSVLSRSRGMGRPIRNPCASRQLSASRISF